MFDKLKKNKIKIFFSLKLKMSFKDIIFVILYDDEDEMKFKNKNFVTP